MENETPDPRILKLYMGEKAAKEFHEMFKTEFNKLLDEQIEKINLEIKNK